jgi:archaemetzincin
MRGLFYFIAVSILSLTSCQNNPSPLKGKPKAKPHLTIVCFNGYEMTEAKKLGRELTAYYGIVVDSIKQDKLPAFTFYKPRSRYLADSILKYLKVYTLKSNYVLGLCHVDIGHQRGKIKDYGIFGLGYQPGLCAVASDCRIKRSKQVRNYATAFLCMNNVVRHELGHNFGLPHCNNKKCLLSAADGSISNIIIGYKKLCQKCHDIIY